MARPLVSPLIAYRQTANRTGPPAGNSRESFRLLPRIDSASMRLPRACGNGRTPSMTRVKIGRL